MSHSFKGNDDDSPPSAPPPSYEEALNAPPVLPGRPGAGSSASHSQPQPARPQVPPIPNRPQQTQNSPNVSGSPHPSLYTNNPNLPFDFPRGYFCKKCKNTGFKEKNGKPCSNCWPKFFKNQAYNPNPELPFTYPRGFVCEKCRNTGLKMKNGRSCQDCYERFAPRNMTAPVPVTSYYRPSSSFPFTPSGDLGFMAPGSGFGGLMSGPGFGPGFGPPGPPGPSWGPSGTPQYVRPGDPRMGGTLCGRCRGSGMVTFFLDQELCSVCGGIGRMFNTSRPDRR